MRKLLLLLAIFFAVLMFAGCSNSDEDILPVDTEASENDKNDVPDNGDNQAADTDYSETGDADADSSGSQNGGSDTPEQPDSDSGSGSNGERPDQDMPQACASAGNSYLGCDFYTAKLYNGRKTEKITSKDSFSVAIANSHPTETATIEFFKTLEDGTETKIENFEYCYKVEKSILGIKYDDMECKDHDSSFVITVNPQETILITPKKEDRMLIGTAASFLSYHIKSDFPVIVYQFNPFYNLSSNDASLVFPSNTLGSDYFIASYQDETNVGGDGPAYFTIIGVNDTSVELEITPTAKIAASGKIPGTEKAYR